MISFALLHKNQYSELLSNFLLITLTNQMYSRTVVAIDATSAFTLGLPLVDVVRKDVHTQWPKLSS